MNDLLIKNARIVDGTGSPAFHGDVAVRGGIISAVGGNGVASLGGAHRSIDAGGALQPRRHHRRDGQLRRGIRLSET